MCPFDFSEQTRCASRGIYDKTHEIKYHSKEKGWFHDLWLAQKHEDGSPVWDSESPVWRIEFRFKRPALHEFDLTLQVSQERRARVGVCWQELAPPGGELTTQAKGYACHTMAPRASIPSLAVRSPSPFLPSSSGPRCYNCATQKGPTWRVPHALGTPFYVVALRGTLLLRVRTARGATPVRKHGY